MDFKDQNIDISYILFAAVVIICIQLLVDLPGIQGPNYVLFQAQSFQMRTRQYRVLLTARNRNINRTADNKRFDSLNQSYREYVNIRCRD